ncbi:hypothetical protein Godav_024959, partial [Gossypium davidsonii]|nr:hypothetical protein [Gossypium davidsonii]
TKLGVRRKWGQEEDWSENGEKENRFVAKTDSKNLGRGFHHEMVAKSEETRGGSTVSRGDRTNRTTKHVQGRGFVLAMPAPPPVGIGTSKPGFGTNVSSPPGIWRFPPIVLPKWLPLLPV